MPRRKDLDEENAQTIIVDSIQKPPTIVSHSQAKKLIKKPLSDAQKASIEKLLEYNKQKREARKAETEKQKQEEEKRLKQDLETKKKEEVIVLPKRVYNKKPKKVVYISETESEESEPEVVVKKKPKEIIVPKTSLGVAKKVDEAQEAIKKIDNILSQTKKYNIFS